GWPEGDAFSPGRGPRWGGPGQRFARRIRLAVAAVALFLFGLGALTAWLLIDHRGLAAAAAVIVVVVGLRAVVLLARSFRMNARPLSEVMDAADRIASGDHDIRVAERGSREMRRLVRSFNAMTDRLATNERRRRELLADIAHELRTPLSVIQGHTEGLLDGLYPANREHLEPLLEE